MLNYMKSEAYRVAHGKELYLFTGALCAVVLAANILLRAMTYVDPAFPYATVRFSLSNLLGMFTMLFALAGLLVAVLYADDRKNGTLKNALSHGCSRLSLFAGKCVVSLGAGLAAMAIVMVVYVGSAVFLLEGPLADTMGIVAGALLSGLPSIVAVVVLAIGLDGYFPKTTVAIVAWAVIVFAIPQALAVIGLRFDAVAAVASWLPANIYGNEMNAAFLGGSFPWETPFGLAKCLIAGFASLALFAGLGAWRARKVEL